MYTLPSSCTPGSCWNAGNTFFQSGIREMSSGWYSPFSTISSALSSTQLLTTSAWNPACSFATASSFELNGEVCRSTFGYCCSKLLM